MKIPKQVAIWGTVAAVSVIVLLLILAHQHNVNQRRWAVNVSPNPQQGSLIFRQKDCGVCHGSNAGGTAEAPALRQRPSASSLPQLVTAMWNHAPRMWRAMETRKLPYPTLTYEETSQLVSYLYISGYADNGGDVARGQRLFKTLRCAQCHGASANNSVPDIESLGDANTPLLWTQALWNHASAMETRMHQLGISWPKFQASDLRDLFAYVRHRRNLPEDSFSSISGDPDKGWALFQSKGCIGCHAVSSESGQIGPQLGPTRSLPPTFSEFGAALLNHFPAMQNAMHEKGAQVPRFAGNDMTDLAVFLYSLHYMEPSGSPQIGRSLFTWRGCSTCHGADAGGTNKAPALRGRGETYTAVRLATDLWRHGERMYKASRTDGQSWPVLEDTDIGNLLAFLNTSPEQ